MNCGEEVMTPDFAQICAQNTGKGMTHPLACFVFEMGKLDRESGTWSLVTQRKGKKRKRK